MKRIATLALSLTVASAACAEDGLFVLLQDAQTGDVTAHLKKVPEDECLGFLLIAKSGPFLLTMQNPTATGSAIYVSCVHEDGTATDIHGPAQRPKIEELDEATQAR